MNHLSTSRDRRLIPSKSASRPLLQMVLSVSITLLATGCFETIEPASVTKFSAGVGEAQAQARLAFGEANALARQQSIEYVISTTRPGISESSFAPALDANAIAAWDAAFASMQSYASSLEQLLSTDQATQFGNDAVDLAAELKTGQVGANISPGVATAFTQLGKILITFTAQQDAKAAMQKADPGVRAVCKEMAKALGSTNFQGVRGTVWTNWQDKLDKGPIHDYSESVRSHGTLDQKRAAAGAYIAMLDQRDAELASLANLRQSLLFLADAHAAAANGSSADVAGVISLISQQADDTKSLFQRFNTKPAPSKSDTLTTGGSHGG